MKKNNLIVIIGWLGTIALLVGYFLLTYKILLFDSILYNLLNLIGGLCLAIRVWVDRNYSNFTFELFFILLALRMLILNK